MADDHKSPAGPADKRDESDPLPAYEEVTPGPLTRRSAATPGSPAAVPSKGPTVESPFDFPADIPAPAYAEASSSSASHHNRRPIAIPQVSPDATAPFVAAYAPSLLGHGIPPESWAAFVDTMSAFLTARVSDRAVSHAADVARRVGRGPAQYGRNMAEHAKSVGRNIGHNAKRGNILGAAMGVVGGVVSLPVHAAVGAVGAVVGLPGSAVAAASKKPKTPRERAEVYAAAANEGWLRARGLRVRLVDSKQLARLIGLSGDADELLAPAFASKETTADHQLRALASWIEELELAIPEGNLRLAEATLWLVITREAGQEERYSH